METSNLLSEDIDFRRAIFALKNVAAALNGATPEDGHDLVFSQNNRDYSRFLRRLLLMFSLPFLRK